MSRVVKKSPPSNCRECVDLRQTHGINELSGVPGYIFYCKKGAFGNRKHEPRTYMEYCSGLFQFPEELPPLCPYSIQYKQIMEELNMKKFNMTVEVTKCSECPSLRTGFAWDGGDGKTNEKVYHCKDGAFGKKDNYINGEYIIKGYKTPPVVIDADCPHVQFTAEEKIAGKLGMDQSKLISILDELGVKLELKK